MVSELPPSGHLLQLLLDTLIMLFQKVTLKGQYWWTEDTTILRLERS